MLCGLGDDPTTDNADSESVWVMRSSSLSFTELQCLSLSLSGSLYLSGDGLGCSNYFVSLKTKYITILLSWPTFEQAASLALPHREGMVLSATFGGRLASGGGCVGSLTSSTSSVRAVDRTRKGNTISLLIVLSNNLCLQSTPFLHVSIEPYLRAESPSSTCHGPMLLFWSPPCFPPVVVFPAFACQFPVFIFIIIHPPLYYSYTWSCLAL